MVETYTIQEVITLAKSESYIHNNSVSAYFVEKAVYWSLSSAINFLELKRLVKTEKL